MNVVATIFPKNTTLVCQFDIPKNARDKCITNYIVKYKEVNMDKKDKEVNEVMSLCFYYMTNDLIEKFLTKMGTCLKY